MNLVDNDSFYIGISQLEFNNIETNGGDLSIIAPERNAYQVLQKVINNLTLDNDDKSRRYRLGNGAYFVHDNFLFARRYSKDKAQKESCNEVILKVSLQKIIQDPDIEILNLLSEDGHYLFYKISKLLQERIMKIFEGLNEQQIYDFNFDAIVIDYIIYETEDKDSFKIGGVAGLIQEPYRTKSYTNDIFNSNDIKNANPSRHITGIRPLDHLEVMIIKMHCPKIDILDIYDQNKIDQRVAIYEDEFVSYFGAN